MVLRTGKLSSQKILQKAVLDEDLCTGCGACVNLCPYQVIYHDRTVQLNYCDLTSGQCALYCPRTEVDLTSLRNALYEKIDLTPELGAVKGYYLSRATDPQLRAAAQHGGTVTALMELALAEGIIKTAIVSSADNECGQEGIAVNEKNLLRKNTGSKFIVSPTVAAFNKIAATAAEKIGLVATPCQALALAKMKLARPEDNAGKIDKLKLVIGLYCGWTLSVEKITNLLLQNKINLSDVTGMDIPAGKKTLEVYNGNHACSIPFEDVQACIRTACGYCMDSTAEFADISVGAARFGDNWEEMREWNQVIVRSQAGREIFDLAVKRGVLEVREAPEASFRELKKAAVEKKKTALKNIIQKTGSAKKLLYLNCDDALIQGLLKNSSRKK
jgi:coenzyme F420 hydrogenase subunit beta